MKRLFVGLILVSLMFLGSNDRVLADCGTPATLPEGSRCVISGEGDVAIPVRDANYKITGYLQATIDPVTGIIVNSDGGANLVSYDNLPSVFIESNTVTINQVAGAFTGQVYGTYSNGSDIISGFYQAPNGGYYAIHTTCRTCRSDGSIRLVTQVESPIYDCPDETYPDFDIGTQSYGTYNCRAGSSNCPRGNRTRIIGYTSDPYVNTRIQITSTCIPIDI